MHSGVTAVPASRYPGRERPRVGRGATRRLGKWIVGCGVRCWSGWQPLRRSPPGLAQRCQHRWRAGTSRPSPTGGASCSSSTNRTSLAAARSVQVGCVGVAGPARYGSPRTVTSSVTARSQSNGPSGIPTRSAAPARCWWSPVSSTGRPPSRPWRARRLCAAPPARHPSVGFDPPVAAPVSKPAVSRRGHRQGGRIIWHSCPSRSLPSGSAGSAGSGQPAGATRRSP